MTPSTTRAIRAGLLVAMAGLAAARKSPAEHASHALLLAVFWLLAGASVYPLVWLLLSSLQIE